MTKPALILLLLLASALLVVACVQGVAPLPAQPFFVVTAPAQSAGGTQALATAQPAPLPSATPSPSPTPTASPSPTLTPTPSATPGPTPDGVVRTARVPILMYHYISTPPPGAHPYRVGNSLDPEVFAAHLDYLQSQGYTTIHIKDLLSYLATGKPELPEKPVILTFDDGYLDSYTNAFPALQARGMTGSFFIITDFATLAAEDEAYFYYATWDQLREMSDAGMEIGAHGRVHLDLAGKDLDYLVWQALGSKETIEANLGYHPRILAYPSGSYDQLVIDVFKSANYWGAVTTHLGDLHSSEHPFELKRVRISSETGVLQLQALLDYDWPP